MKPPSGSALHSPSGSLTKPPTGVVPCITINGSRQAGPGPEVEVGAAVAVAEGEPAARLACATGGDGAQLATMRVRAQTPSCLTKQKTAARARGLRTLEQLRQALAKGLEPGRCPVGEEEGRKSRAPQDLE